MTRSRRKALVALNSASIVALLAGFHSSGRYKSCEEDRTRRIFFQQHNATAAVVSMMLTPKKTAPGTGDVDDSFYDVAERARRSRASFLETLGDASCGPWDRGAQVFLCLSAALQILSGLAALLWNKD